MLASSAVPGRTSHAPHRDANGRPAAEPQMTPGRRRRGDAPDNGINCINHLSQRIVPASRHDASGPTLHAPRARTPASFSSR
ncbi:Hypothetical protein I596_3251 [Dokdonella koreensis DS-123]|uniref:Uncharacterized protein n=1 Tax=Dokdonella koreensis DS-123 TaxID=1300342 RepID=A0A160DXW7_9GAMM|nr:Hypothetical protein I596_3251 [Dokdonella koreensis DS-123]